MRLTTLVEILEREIGASVSARSELALLLAERAEKDALAKPVAAPQSRAKTPSYARAERPERDRSWDGRG